MNPIDQDKGTPISVVIRNRLKDARKRFHANDNISAYIEPGELGQLLDEVEQKMKEKEKIEKTSPTDFYRQDLKDLRLQVEKSVISKAS